jgi:hypothetical protein
MFACSKNRCTGTYASEVGFSVTVAVDAAGILTASTPELPSVALAPAGSAVFKAVTGDDMTLEFGGAAGTNFSELTITNAGRVMRLTRKD